MLGNGVCNVQCLTWQCNWDYGDYVYCTTNVMFVVSLSYTGNWPNFWTFCNLMEAIINSQPTSNIIYLIGGDFDLSTYVGDWGGLVNPDPLTGMNFAQIEITPYYCSYGYLEGCYQDGVMPVITMNNNWVQFSVYYPVILTNVTISHHYSFSSTCPSCDYCPYAANNSLGVVVDDRGNPLTPGGYLDYNTYCKPFAALSLFKVYYGGSLVLQVKYS